MTWIIWNPHQGHIILELGTHWSKCCQFSRYWPKLELCVALPVQQKSINLFVAFLVQQKWICRSTSVKQDCWKTLIWSAAAANGLQRGSMYSDSGDVPLSEYNSTAWRIPPSTSPANWMKKKTICVYLALKTIFTSSRSTIPQNAHGLPKKAHLK